jgi:hypothetical protein
LTHSVTALRLLRKHGDDIAIGRALNCVGWYLVRLGHPHFAIPLCVASVRSVENGEDPVLLAHARHSLGAAQLAAGALADAGCTLRQSMRDLARIGAVEHYVTAAQDLAEALRRTGHHSAAARVEALAERVADDRQRRQVEAAAAWLNDLDAHGELGMDVQSG